MSFKWEPCIFRWNWLVVDFADKNFSFCCKTPDLKLETESEFNFEKLANHPAILSSQKNLLAKQKDPACKLCWQLEEAGVESPRIQWKGSEQFKESNRSQPLTLEVVLDDLCNLECVYCGPHRSSRWKKRKGLETKNTTDKIWNSFLNWFESSDCEFGEIHITGGEPFFSPRFQQFFDLIEAKSRKQKEAMRLAVISNLQIQRGKLKKNLDALCRLPESVSVFIEFSNESRGSRSEFIRYGLDQKIFESNLEFMCESYGHRIKLAGQITLNALSVPSLDAYTEYLLDLTRRFDCNLYPIANIVKNPTYLDPLILDQLFSCHFHSAAQRIEKQAINFNESMKVRWQRYSRYLSSLGKSLDNKKASEVNRDQVSTLKKYIENLDSSRGTDFNSTFPEFTRFFKEYSGGL